MIDGLRTVVVLLVVSSGRICIVLVIIITVISVIATIVTVTRVSRPVSGNDDLLVRDEESNDIRPIIC